MPKPDAKKIAANIERASKLRVKHDAEKKVAQVLQSIMKKRGTRKAIKETEERFGKLDRGNTTFLDILIRGLFARAMDGDIDAAREIFDRMEGPANKKSRVAGTSHGRPHDLTADVRFLIEGLK